MKIVHDMQSHEGFREHKIPLRTHLLILSSFSIFLCALILFMIQIHCSDGLFIGGCVLGKIILTIYILLGYVTYIISTTILRHRFNRNVKKGKKYILFIYLVPLVSIFAIFLIWFIQVTS